ncbi:MAG: DUF2764 domain-containing protein [Bacteroidales bacterium]|nr:DUF2764 domain-containing protein [Bacteroidales bacterium]
MNNYQYIIASLPVLSKDWKASRNLDCDEIVSSIRSECSRKDKALIDTLTDGYDDEKLGKEFYEEACSSRNSFISEYFSFDLKLRNAKVRYLNGQLGRPADQDIFLDIAGTPEEKEAMSAAFLSQDILEREKNVDDLMWEKIDEMTLFNYFDINAILGFIAKLHIIQRWLRLDEETGRQMFSRLVAEIKGTFKGVQYDAE